MSEIDPEQISRAVGARIRQLRLGKNIAIKEVAERTGMHRPLVSRVELGTYMPRLDTILRIAQALDVRVADIVYVIDADPNPEPEETDHG